MKKLEIENDEEYTVSEVVEKFNYFKNLLLNLAKTSEVPLNIGGNLVITNYKLIIIKMQTCLIHIMLNCLQI